MKKATLSALILMMLSLFFFTMFICPVQQCSAPKMVDKVSSDEEQETKEDLPILKGTRRLLSRAFNISTHDVMVVLHIQKTGGTVFGRNLVQNLKLQRPCEFKEDNIYECKRPGSNQIWLYSRYSTGWICGTHSGYTELASCMPDILRKQGAPVRLNRIFYVTWLRDPIERFLSEFGHVRRGATWRTVRHICNGKQYMLPKCYHGDDWRNVSLKSFLNCPYNLAFNRQTRMMANISQVGCYGHGDSTEKQRTMLRSAKKNLRNFAFIGLVEQQEESQFVFEQTFGLKFQKPFVQRTRTFSKITLNHLSPVDIRKIRLLNKLDVQLYEYAKDLFRQRLEYFKELRLKKKPTA